MSQYVALATEQAFDWECGICGFRYVGVRVDGRKCRACVDAGVTSREEALRRCPPLSREDRKS